MRVCDDDGVRVWLDDGVRVCDDDGVRVRLDDDVPVLESEGDCCELGVRLLVGELLGVTLGLGWLVGHSRSDTL